MLCLSCPVDSLAVFLILTFIQFHPPYTHIWGFPDGSGSKESACNVGALGSSLGHLGRYSGECNGYQLRYFCLENSMDREAWWATICRVTKSRT